MLHGKQCPSEGDLVDDHGVLYDGPLVARLEVVIKRVDDAVEKFDNEQR